MAKMDNLQELYEDLLIDAYSQEKQILDAMPRMIDAASTPDLRDSLQQHHRQTQAQFETIQQILESNAINPRNKVCVGMQGLLREGEELIRKKGKIDDVVLDAGLIASAQKVEHYEISNYGSLREFARVLGHRDQADKLNRILDQEYEADRKLSALAEGGLNWEAKKR